MKIAPNVENIIRFKSKRVKKYLKNQEKKKMFQANLNNILEQIYIKQLITIPGTLFPYYSVPNIKLNKPIKE